MFTLSQEQYNNLKSKGATDDKIKEYVASKNGGNYQNGDNKSNYDWSEVPGKFISNFPSTALNVVGGFGNAITHPVSTIKDFGQIGAGALQSIPGVSNFFDEYSQGGAQNPVLQENRQKFQNTLKFFSDRYGSVENFKKTLAEDPAGFLLDLSVVFDVGASAAGKVGDISKIEGISKAGEVMGKAGESVNPISLLGKTTGEAINKTIGGREIAPFKGSYLPDVEKTAQEQGVNLPVSAMTTNKGLQTTEAILGKGFFGGGIQNLVSTARDSLMNIASDITNKVGGVSDLKSVGENIQKGFQAYTDEFNKTKTELYDKVPENIKSVPAQTTKTVETLQSVLGDFKQSLIGNKAETIFKNLMDNIRNRGTDFIAGKKGTLPTKGDITFEELKRTRSEIGNMLKNRLDPITTGAKSQLGRLYGALSDDLDATISSVDPIAKKSLDEANKFYKEGINKINSKIGKKIANSDPEKLVDTLVKPNSETVIKQIKDVVPKEQFESLQVSFLNKIFANSIKKGVLDSEKLLKQVTRYGDNTLRELFNPEQYNKIQQTIADLQKVEKTQGAIKSGTKIAEGSQTGFIEKISLLKSGLGAAGFINPSAWLALMGDFGLEKVASKLFESKLGRDFMTKGIKISEDVGSSIKKLKLGAGLTAGYYSNKVKSYTKKSGGNQ